ncbi:XVIPCD domain-containing protein [Variovorax sp. CCNWLW235]|uniref:XVIPCD domain-containing protein n=1 Tax=Variovorax sp. CCNWLW235 TaxID=3127463 RepID=UPI0030775502
MTITSRDYALLAKDSYKDHEPNHEVVLGDVKYRTFDHEDNPTTGFQATAYQRIDTGEVVIAYRGTEFGREPVQDGLVDVGMALAGVNAQARDANAFTQKVLDKAKADAEKNNQPLNVTVTGHSLGGTLAQLHAHKFGLKGETINAFGAAGLVHGVPKGGHQAINHVRAGDPVSAASAHFGEVRVYAVQQDIDTLGKAGYRDDGGALSARNPAKATDFSAHFADNFSPDGETLGRSIISPENEARYHAHRGMIDRYRNDVYNARAIASVPLQNNVHAAQAVGQGVTAVGRAAGQAYDAVRDTVTTGTQRAGLALQETGQKIRDDASRAVDRLTRPWLHSQTEAAPLLNQPGHPGNGLYKQALAGLEKINAEHSIPSDQRTCNAAGTLAASACESRLKQIDHVVLNDNGSKLIAVQGQPGAALSKVIGVDTVVALNTPLAQSSQAFAEAQNQQQNQQPLQVNRPVQAQPGPVLA